MPEAATHTLVLTPSGRRGAVVHGANLLEAARSLGVELESICGGRQTCGKCQVVVEEGHFAKHGLTSTAAHAAPTVRADTVAAQPLPGRILACACTVSGDLLISVPDESQARKQIIAQGRHRARHRSPAGDAPGVRRGGAPPACTTPAARAIGSGCKTR